jgi:peptidoglycan/LPS O-acetylase OafA/YrhL
MKFNQIGEMYGDMRAVGSPMWIFIPTVGGACFAGIILAYLSVPTLGGQVPSVVDKIFSHGGRVSHSMYLTHLLTLSVSVAVLKQYGPKIQTWEAAASATVLVAIPMVVAVSTITYFAIEKPMMDLKLTASTKSRPALDRG